MPGELEQVATVTSRQRLSRRFWDGLKPVDAEAMPTPFRHVDEILDDTRARVSSRISSTWRKGVGIASASTGFSPSQKRRERRWRLVTVATCSSSPGMERSSRRDVPTRFAL